MLLLAAVRAGDRFAAQARQRRIGAMAAFVALVKGGAGLGENRRSSSGRLGRVAAIGSKAQFTRVCAGVQPIASNTRSAYVPLLEPFGRLVNAAGLR